MVQHSSSLTWTLLAWSGPEGRSREACSVAVTSPNAEEAESETGAGPRLSAGQAFASTQRFFSGGGHSPACGCTGPGSCMALPRAPEGFLRPARLERTIVTTKRPNRLTLFKLRKTTSSSSYCYQSLDFPYAFNASHVCLIHVALVCLRFHRFLLRCLISGRRFLLYAEWCSS